MTVVGHYSPLADKNNNFSYLVSSSQNLLCTVAMLGSALGTEE